MEAEVSSSLLLLKEEKEDLEEGLTENTSEGSLFADPFSEVKAEPEFFDYGDFDVYCSSQSAIKCENDSFPNYDDESGKKKISIAEENRHLGRSNSAGKRLICPECQRTFLRIDKLKSHIRIHRVKKPYICSVCQKSFSVSWHLKTHMRTHTGDKSYTGSVRQRSFSASSNLTKHENSCKRECIHLPNNLKRHENSH